MRFPIEPEVGVVEAVAGLRASLAAHCPAGPVREAAEERLRDVERFALAGAASLTARKDGPGDGICIAEPAEAELRWAFISPEFARMHAAAAGPPPGEPASAGLDTDRLAIHFREAIETGQPQDFEVRSERPECPIELQTRVTPLTDSAGAVRWVAAISRDVTEQRLADRQLRKQNRRLQNILSSISDGFIVADREWRITFVNSRAEQILGAPRTRLLGAAITDLLPELQGGSLRDAIEVEYAPEGAARRWIGVRTYPSQDGASLYLQDVTERREAEAALLQGLVRVQATLDGVVNAMVYAVELRDPYTGGHQRRVSALACAICRVLGYDSGQIETMRIGGLLHDVGKVSIPSEILNRPGRLTEPERIIVRTHAQMGYDILKEIEFDSPVALIALQHHERLDGSGYPHGLQSEAIIPEAKILAVADVVEAMASHRPYRPALGVECALNEVMSHRGLRYDDDAVGACLKAFTDSGFDFDLLMQTELSRRGGDQRGGPIG
ncbi:MAG TPA: HD domain-containing phosphohydrolase [Chthonomonadaceae bacterium]|nr:HD domain-containing phosphohydrolase [Chthonomonadaceae bacterium]